MMAKRSRAESTSSEPDDISSEQQFHPSRNQSAEPESHTPKYAYLEEPAEKTLMHCTLPPHPPLSFSTYTNYETHYEQLHTNRCEDCQKNFPSAHFLDLHIAENHDPLLATKRDAGEKIYACFVEGCEKVCREWKKRRSHLVDKHGFPRNYDFLVVDSGIDGRKSMLRRGVDEDGHRRSSREREGVSNAAVKISPAVQETADVRPDGPAQATSGARLKPPRSLKGGGTLSSFSAAAEDDVNALANSMSSLKMVPRSVSFGKRTGRGGFARS